MLDVIYYLIWVVYSILSMSYEGFVTILLTALGVMLAVLAIIIGLVAVFGYAQIKEEVRNAAMKHADAAMEAKLKEYPDASKFIELYQELQSFYLIQRKLVVDKPEPVPETVAKASNVEVKEEKAKPVPVTPIQQYPGEEQANANTKSAPPASDTPDTGADHS